MDGNKTMEMLMCVLGASWKHLDFRNRLREKIEKVM